MKEVDEMAASLVIEAESGTCTRQHHQHNGYYAGDFSDVPLPTQSQLTALMTLCRVPAQQRTHH